ncbi:family A G protein-coupled receptor-like protein [Conidiobolus coronatus NRRL 28638]|uniref:Family A G protein-coupled receptor-like protein n=1 Tax=Conidiobolus coronatus (strain ATCC 28846 / CBS 209.66 / NRRL 28638) TaxID=796925 RepID=A0A137NWB1_CONC2|nr:family A G protein-coupled receptor-like protein [Conidiobolus coronatus NRRL 28638]|eukprot:KXN66978.1 family A G protein-coupled receptor-like protein [Conidiobolus coronatus NRRL 28638]
MNSTSIPGITGNGNRYSETLGSFVLTLDILEVILGIAAILINCLTIYILTAKLKLKQSDTILSFIVSIFDILYSSFSIINYSILWITNHSAILVTIYSQFNGYLFFCVAACMIDSVMLLSLIRFLAICKQVQLSNKFCVMLILGLVTFNFIFGLIPLIQNQFKVQPSLKYSSVEFNLENNWSVNCYYCFLWIKLAINMVVIMGCYFYISIFYYNYLKNYTKEEVEESEKLPKFNRGDLGGVEFDTGSTKLELGKDSNRQKKEERRMVREVSNHIIDNSATQTGQSNFQNNYTIDNLIRSTLSKLYIMLIIYMLESIPVFLIQTIFKLSNIPISSALDSVGSFLVHLIPITNPCFVLFFHFETYQELRFFIYINYYKLFN